MSTSLNPESLRPRTKAEVGKYILQQFRQKKLQGMGQCRYRGNQGKPCALGACIPNDMATCIKSHGLNEESVIALDNAGIDITPYFGGLTIDDLTKIQRAFDSRQRKRFISVVERRCGLTSSQRK